MWMLGALGCKMPLVLASSKLLPLSPSPCAGQATNVFLNMEGDFMKPVISIVDELLEAGVNVTVYNGQLDLIVDTMGRNHSEGCGKAVSWLELQGKWPFGAGDFEMQEEGHFLLPPPLDLHSLKRAELKIVTPSEKPGLASF